MLGVISALISCLQTNIAMISSHPDYVRRRINLMRSISKGAGATGAAGAAAPVALVVRGQQSALSKKFITEKY